jgi:uncharacterized YccA/Bax inhibitor family protein
MDVFGFNVVRNTPRGKEIITKTKGAVEDITIKFADLVVAAFGIVSALAFNDAVKSLFAEGGMFEKFAKGGPWVAAFVIMIITVAVGYWRARLIPIRKAEA